MGQGQQQASEAAPATSPSTSPAAPGSAVPEQDTLGNAALTERLGAAPAEEGGGLLGGEAQEDWRDGILADRGALVGGAKLVDSYALEREGPAMAQGFADARLEHARSVYAAKLGVVERAPSAEPPAAAQPDAGASAGPGKAPSARASDSPAKDVASAPAWFNAFQDHCIGTADWTKDEEVMQVLVSAYLHAAHQAAPENAQVFFDNAGKSELNGRGGDLVYGGGSTKGSEATRRAAMVENEDWCQAASTAAFGKALQRCGYIMTPRALSAELAAQMGLPAGQYNDQSTLAMAMVIENPSVKAPSAKDTPKVQARMSGVQACWDAALEPGDMVSFVSKASNAARAGHVVTLVDVPPPTKDGQPRRISFVSGNAGSDTAGNGSVRYEEATWAPPPSDFHVSNEAGHSATRPTGDDEVYVWSATRLSAFLPNSLDAIRKDLDPATFEGTYHMRYDPSLDTREAPSPE